MAKVAIGYTDYIKETLKALSSGGALLVSQGNDGKPNVMTIGWGMIGIIWGRNIFTVLVRPSRYTFKLIEENGDFTVNVPPKELAKFTAFSGGFSGRDHDKLAEHNISISPGRVVNAPIIDKCVIHYECRSIHKNDVLNSELAREIVSSAYPAGDFHKIYYGEILAAYADEEVNL